MPLKIGTRGSRLALVQAGRVAALLGDLGYRTELSIITTRGDEVDGVPLHEIGGQGVFVRALDDAILNGAIDCAVHSMKDIPAFRPEGVTRSPFSNGILRQISWSMRYRSTPLESSGHRAPGVRPRFFETCRAQS